MKSRRVYFEAVGGPDVLKVESVEVAAPGAGEVLIRHTAIGVNYVDVYQRKGVFPAALPSGIGSEAAGTVEALGPGVNGFKVGDRVAYMSGAPGAYSDRRTFSAERLVKLPASLTDADAAALFLKGMTVEFLFERCAPLKAGEWGLIYAAAGGIGLIAGQWARSNGVKLIGIVGGEAKKKLAEANGYEAVIDRNSEDIIERVKSLAGGKGVAAVYDAIGKATFDTSLKCLAPRGIFVSFGGVTGAAPPVDPGVLMRGGSLFFTRPALMHYTGSQADFEQSSRAVLQKIASGALRANIGQRYPLEDAARAHIDLESGTTSGASLIVP